MPRVTIASLTERLNAEREAHAHMRELYETTSAGRESIAAQYRELEAKYEALEAKLQLAEQLVAQIKAPELGEPGKKYIPITRKVFEWDATVPGDFRRASRLAREHRGIVQRAIPR